VPVDNAPVTASKTITESDAYGEIAIGGLGHAYATVLDTLSWAEAEEAPQEWEYQGLHDLSVKVSLVSLRGAQGPASDSGASGGWSGRTRWLCSGGRSQAPREAQRRSVFLASHAATSATTVMGHRWRCRGALRHRCTLQRRQRAGPQNGPGQSVECGGSKCHTFRLICCDHCSVLFLDNVQNVQTTVSRKFHFRQVTSRIWIRGLARASVPDALEFSRLKVSGQGRALKHPCFIKEFSASHAFL